MGQRIRKIQRIRVSGHILRNSRECSSLVAYGESMAENHGRNLTCSETAWTDPWAVLNWPLKRYWKLLCYSITRLPYQEIPTEAFSILSRPGFTIDSRDGDL